MVSIRQLAACLNVSGVVISLQTLFGQLEPPFSLRDRIAEVMQRKVDLNIICVGSELFTESDKSEIKLAVELTRSFFAAVDLGIGQVTSYGIPLLEAGGHEYIDGDDEAEALSVMWSPPGTAIDVFIVRSYEGPTIGRGPEPGSCKQGQDNDLEAGLVVAIEATQSITAITLAHELGHYLGQPHDGDPFNLMFEKVSPPNSGILEAKQGDEMKRHCIVYTACRLP